MSATKFDFRNESGDHVTPEGWLRIWAPKYPDKGYPGYEALISRFNSHPPSAPDIECVGKWKDRANSDKKWKPNIASVAYEIWMEAANEISACPATDEEVRTFLDDWSNRGYSDTYRNGGTLKKTFGLSRATTLLHFLTAGEFPIFDSRARRALGKLLCCSVPSNTAWYLDRYRGHFNEIATLCAADKRAVDKALFAFGARRNQS